MKGRGHFSSRNEIKDVASDQKSWETMTLTNDFGRYTGKQDRPDDYVGGVSQTHDEEDMRNLLLERKDHDASINTHKMGDSR